MPQRGRVPPEGRPRYTGLALRTRHARIGPLRRRGAGGPRFLRARARTQHPLMARSAEALTREWLAALAHERRASAHTLRAYGDDIERFLVFAREHTGEAVSENTLVALTPADIRAFVTQRRKEGLGAPGVHRALSAVRSLFRYLAREQIVDNPAPRAV